MTSESPSVVRRVEGIAKRENSPYQWVIHSTMIDTNKCMASQVKTHELDVRTYTQI